MKKFSDRYDVIVCGGGPAGIAAAVSSARQGAKTALVERYGIVGGMLTAGMVCPLLGSVAPGTIYDEVIELLHSTWIVTKSGKEMTVGVEEAKHKLLQFVVDAGVDLFLQTPVVDTVKDGNTVKGVVISTQSGLKTLHAKVVIDATGDGFVAASAGAQCLIGRDSDGKCQPVTLEFIVENCEEECAITCWGTSDPVTLSDGTKYSEFCKMKSAQGELPENVSIVRLHKTRIPGERGVNATQVNGLDTLTPEGILAAELELRNQIEPIVTFLRKYVQGFENCRLKSTPSTLGVRETRRVVGDYMLNDADVETGATKADVAVHKAWFLIDIHNPVGGGQAEGHARQAILYDIPYGCLLPLGLENILTCGRCISGTHRAHASYRVMGICLATGQAAGVAAALSALAGIAPRELPAAQLQTALQRSGAQLFD